MESPVKGVGDGVWVGSFEKRSWLLGWCSKLTWVVGGCAKEMDTQDWKHDMHTPGRTKGRVALLCRRCCTCLCAAANYCLLTPCQRTTDDDECDEMAPAAAATAEPTSNLRGCTPRERQHERDDGMVRKQERATKRQRETKKGKDEPRDREAERARETERRMRQAPRATHHPPWACSPCSTTKPSALSRSV